MSNIKQLYKEAFPPKEYLSLSHIIKMAKDCNTVFLAPYDKELFVVLF